MGKSTGFGAGEVHGWTTRFEPPPEPPRRGHRQDLERFDPPDYAELCLDWAQRDTWPLKAGLNLLRRCHPQKRAWDNGVLRLWRLARRSISADGSLPVTKTGCAGACLATAETLRVRPLDLLDWADRQDVPIPLELSEAVRGRPEVAACHWRARS